MLQLLVRRARRHQQALAVPRRQAPDDARAGDRAVAYGDDILELGLEDTAGVSARTPSASPVPGGTAGVAPRGTHVPVEVLARADGDERV